MPKRELKKWWKSKALKFMLASIILGVATSIAMFTILGIYMGNSSGNTVDKVAQMYMQGMGKQVAKRYETAIQLRLDMVEALAESEQPNGNSHLSIEDRKKINEELKKDALARGFEYLAYLDADGNVDMVLGQSTQLIDPEPFKDSLISGEKKVAAGIGIDINGVEDNNIIFMGIPIKGYIMNDGVTPCIALIAGMSNEDIITMLDMDRDDATMVYSHIIRKDGTFVIQGEKEVHEYADYFEQIRAVSKDGERHIKELSEKMEKHEIYSSTIVTKDQHIHLYCEKLAMSEWYLVTIMDYDTLDSVISNLNSQWIGIVVTASLLMTVVLLCIFLIYVWFSRQNIKQLAAAREAAIKANKTKSEFLSNMSHDIRTPMNAIVGMTAIARSNIDNPEQVQDCLKKISLSSKHLLGLINDVLDMSKIESGKMKLNMEQLSLREALNGIATIVQPQLKMKQQNFDIYISDIITEEVYCDSVRLNQVFLNLLSNAIKFTPEAGMIEVFLNQEASPLGDNFVRNHIRVKDNGIGMTKEFKEKIFESFTREDNARVNKTEGTGLGMAITKYIVDAMNGSIEVDSEVGKGTLFHITLDLEKAVEREEEMNLPNWKMLVVDDDEILCQTTIASLNEIGIQADWTLSGEAAISKVINAFKQGNKYDIILMDWKLPGIDGLEASKQLRKELGDAIPIMLISAYDWSELENKAQESGITGFISKPLFKSTLYYGLREFAHQMQQEATPQIEDKPPVEPLKDVHILLAEDNDLNWEIAQMLLSGLGASLDHAENGQICVDMFSSSKPGTYDIILMDIRMPLMSGLEATEAIRKLDHPNKDIPIIAMTADAFSDDIKKCLDCGMNAHISKPIDIDAVQTTILKFLKKNK
ncbi:MAG: response regulator [Anaeroplasmataceae bacterium]|nr:response regulator [Anaeroplasmataceae bacterium]MDE6414936.1 response regulator [Anaeroplasmataceae bacterium]